MRAILEIGFLKLLCEITKDQAIFLNGETIYEY